MKTLRHVGELGMIHRIRRTMAGGPGVKTGIGDDTAVLAVTPGTLLLATTDLLIEDVHFRWATASPRDIGWKAMAVNVSDIAAMGGHPRWALVAVALPASTEIEAVDACYAGLGEAAASSGVAIVGGDTSASPSGWMINVTLLGEHPATPKLRSMARPGDAVAVTGTLGRSAAGLGLLETDPIIARTVGDQVREELTGAHLRPVPRLREGAWLGGQSGVHAMIDCSDGLATDLGHLCEESEVGARVIVDRLPIAAATRAAARALGKDAMEWATGGGEDYELLLTCDPSAVDSISAGLLDATGTTLSVIGRVEQAPAGVTYVDASGLTVTVRAGYQHFDG